MIRLYLILVIIYDQCLKIIISLCIYKYFFKYFRHRYAHDFINFLNDTIHLRGKKLSLSHKINLINSCAPKYINPGQMALRFSRIECRNTSSIDLPFRSVEILYFSHVLVFLGEPSIGHLEGMPVVHYLFLIKSVFPNICKKLILLIEIETKLYI